MFLLVLILYRKNILFMSFKTIYRIFNLITVKILLGGKNKKQKTSSEKSKKEIFHNEANKRIIKRIKSIKNNNMKLFTGSPSELINNQRKKCL
ncbi:hypothetical protein BUZ80_10265 [Staphylococcus saprophyticus]|nr:hypothetical protein BUZ80_10265 [Staphylococcus saprophyticus]